MVGLIANRRPADASQQTVVSSVDLTQAFHTRSAWRFTATQGAQVNDIFSDPSSSQPDKLPGVITLCLHKVSSRECDRSLSGDLNSQGTDRYFDASHFLRKFEIVHPRSEANPLLLIRTTNLSSGDGSTGVLTQILSYDRKNDKFRRIYRQVVGSNGNEEVRYITSGPLKGDVITAEPTANAPYGYWVTVQKLTSDIEYRQILKYRSATHYGDGNSLAVIDSEMPNIERRLELWRPGRPLPLPASGCPHAKLVHSELWCLP